MPLFDSSLLSSNQAVLPEPAAAGSRPSAPPEKYQPAISRKIRSKDLASLARQLATLLHAGMPLVPALLALVEQFGDEPLAEIMQRIADRVNAGSALSAALKEYPYIFSGLFVNMVAAGEASGCLEEVLLRLAEMLEKRLHLAGKVKAAVAYPLMMVIVAVAVVVFLLSYVVPGLAQIFLEMDRPLPWPTKLLISVSAFIKTYFIFIAVLICAACFALAAASANKDAKLILDRFKLKLPLFGGLFLKLEIARLARTLAVLLASGLPILSALETAKGVVQNSFIADAVSLVKRLIARGDNIASAIRKTGLFPPVVLHIIAAGQAGGDLENGLFSIADMYDNEVELSAKTLTSLLEPAILLVMGAVVGFIVMAILLPIFDINQVI